MLYRSLAYLIVAGWGGLLVTWAAKPEPTFPAKQEPPQVVLPRPYPKPSSLVLCEIINTGPLEVNRQTFTYTWTNNTDSDLLIRSVEIWIGAAKGTVADLDGQLTLTSNGSMLEHIGWDHYSDPAAPNHFKRREFPKDADVILAKGESVTFRCFGNPVIPKSDAGHHWIVTLGVQYLP